MGRLRTLLAFFATLGAMLALTSPVRAATAPSTPIDLFNAYRACSTDANAPTYLTGRGGTQIEGLVTDPSGPGSQLTEQFEVWPVSDPTQITSLSNLYITSGYEASVQVPASALSDGQTYAWQAQGVSAGGSSDWSAPCYFTVDNTAPSTVPTVTSSNYLPGQPNQGGAPVELTFNANGDSDVEGFVFSWTGDFPVAGGANIGAYGIPQPIDPYQDADYFAKASALGGSTTVKLMPPHGGFLVLTVASLDRAYNRSQTTTYSFLVSDTSPTLTQLTRHPQYDKPARFALQANPGLQAASPVVGYTVQFYGDTQKTIDLKATPDGRAWFQVTLDSTTADAIWVTSTSQDGWVSDAAYLYIPMDTTPTVSSNVYPENQSSGGVGTPGTFAFAPKVDDVASYTYSFNYGPPITVKAGAHGVARITWTPTQSGFVVLYVYATTRSGVQLTSYNYRFTVN